MYAKYFKYEHFLRVNGICLFHLHVCPQLHHCPPVTATQPVSTALPVIGADSFQKKSNKLRQSLLARSLRPDLFSWSSEQCADSDCVQTNPIEPHQRVKFFRVWFNRTKQGCCEDDLKNVQTKVLIFVLYSENCINEDDINANNSCSCQFITVHVKDRHNFLN